MFEQYTPLTTTQKEILNQVEEQNLLKKPSLMRSDPYKRDRTKYCQYHRNHSYDNEDYFKLKEEIKNFICQRQLRQLIVSPKRHPDYQADCQAPRPPCRAPPLELPLTKPLVQDIHTIIEGLGHLRTSNKFCKQHIRATR